MSFPADQRYCVLDYETYSEAPLKKVGSFEYSTHPSTEVLCVAWRIGTRETLRLAQTMSWSDRLPGPALHTLLDAFKDPSCILVAHNALFEQVITRNVFSRDFYSQLYLKHLPPSRWLCTASLAATLALPRSLEGAAKALGLKVQKDMEGNKLLQKWCKPRKATKNNPSIRHDDAAELARLIQYCRTDVDTETELFLKTRPLSAFERKVWELDQAINLRGFLVDRELVGRVLKLLAVENENLNKRAQNLSLGVLRSATQRNGVLEWLKGENVFLPDLTKKTVDDTLQAGLATGVAADMLKVRSLVSKTSTAKYQAFEMRSRHDSRVRDILVYHAASTGRWGGAGVQPQNFPRGTVKQAAKVAERLRTDELEEIRFLYGEPMEVFSSCLRNMIIAPPGKVFHCGDYAAIEARVLFWVAKHESGLKAFRENRDLYRELAKEIFGVPATEVDDRQRFVGKQATLGSGYGMGWKKFIKTCAIYGQEVSDELAQAAITAYRTIHRPVVVLWDNIQRAALAAVREPGKRFTINHTTWFCKAGFLWCILPSGRYLAYYGPSIKQDLDPWGEKRPTLYHWGIDTKIKQWVNSKTYGGRLVENVVQAISRDLMADAMIRIDEVKLWEIVLSVHDELLGESDEFGGGSLERFKELMEALPPWAEGLPVKVEVWEGVRYRK